ncbi:MAG: 6-phosphogluconolactonase [Leptolyngbyaceae bacterium]|nr:6-phosphogluconolactonase [Leptolyngbyaceae bacterium]
MSYRRIEVLLDKSAIVARSLELVRDRIQQAIATKGCCTLALAGGSTPKPLYEALAQCELDWSKLHVFWGDERYVPVDHPDSNEGMARQAWLNQVAIPPENIHPMPTTMADPAIAAHTYHQDIQAFFQLEPGMVPAFDIILLGMGDDGHTASLFPHTPALGVCDRLVTVGDKNGEPRLTVTIPLLNQAHCVIFLVAGANKQTALQQVLATGATGDAVDANSVPARYVNPQGELWWLLDQAADGGQDYQQLNQT